jgi:hypothetical protein
LRHFEAFIEENLKIQGQKYLLNFEVWTAVLSHGIRPPVPPIDVVRTLEVILGHPRFLPRFLSGSLESDVCSRKQPLGNIPRLVQSSKFRLALDY